ncbi:MAG TPA: hypothetical protein DCG75_15990 [Bacteroidales bacterium]|nr:hypothetical protein [Bacteroidales bacterium]
MKIYWSLILFSIIILSFSCIKDAPSDFDNPESTWNPSFSFPVGYTSLNMNEESGFNMSLLNDLDNSGYPDWIDEIDVPMSYSMPFDMQELNNLSDQIILIMFRLNTYNGFPAIAKGQVYFIDLYGQVVDSMFVDGPLNMEAGKLAGDGQTVNPTHDQNDVVFDQDKIDDLANVRYILIEGAILNVSLDSTLIDYYRGYSLELQLGVQAELNMSL